MQQIKNWCISAYIEFNKKIAEVKTYVNEYFFINDVKTLQKNVWLRFMLMMCIIPKENTNLSILRETRNKICDFLDINSDSFQITLTKNKCRRKLIVRNKSLKDLLHKITNEKIDYDNTLYGTIFTQFDIHDQNTHISIRNHIHDYKDNDANYDHTIENIIKYNYGEFNFINAKITITRFTKKGLQKYVYDYDTHKMHHINFYLKN